MRRIERRPASAGKVCAFTGHRPKRLAYLNRPESTEYKALKARLGERIDEMISEGCTHFLSGGALGIDTLCALIILEKREKDPHLTLEMVLPCPEQAELWSGADKSVHARLLERADIITETSREYTPACMHIRNRFMVDACDVLLAVYDGSAGGTRDTLKYALERGTCITLITP
ncbi:MAG: DUF1273 family protein [Clostridia bacterium]|nr:DUF1273 family protein [Clostridia bacterium]